MMTQKLPCVVYTVLLLVASSAAHQSALGHALDLLPELQEILSEPTPSPSQHDDPDMNTEQLENASELFTMVMPTIRKLMEQRSLRETHRPLDKQTTRTLDRVERLIPKVIKLVGAIAGHQNEQFSNKHRNDDRSNRHRTSVAPHRNSSDRFGNSSPENIRPPTPLSQMPTSIENSPFPSTFLNDENEDKYNSPHSLKPSPVTKFRPMYKQLLNAVHDQSEEMYEPTSRHPMRKYPFNHSAERQYKYKQLSLKRKLTDDTQLDITPIDNDPISSEPGKSDPFKFNHNKFNDKKEMKSERPPLFGANPFIKGTPAESHMVFYNLPGGGYVYSERSQ